MNGQRTEVTVGLRTAELEALDELAARGDMSREAVLRAALRLYQSVIVKQQRGYGMTFLDADGKPEPTFSMLPPDLV